MFECPLNKAVLQHANKLKFLCLNTTGYDLIDWETIREKQISVANTPGFSTEAVAEHTFALILALVRHIISADADVRKSPFQINPTDKLHEKYAGYNLQGKNLGIYGLGAIGTHVARIAAGFGMNVFGYSRSNHVLPGVKTITNLDEMLSQCDILTLHAPLNKDSANLINAENIQRIKHGALIINTARGGCVNSADLANALHSGRIGGAGLDVLDMWGKDNPLFGAPNTVITPHSAWFTGEAMDKIGDIITANVRAYIAGKPQNIVTG
ncbi:unnamed protein product [Sphagnum jensenii]|uniref:Glycerate dehydrogenase n=1 Tax=Sphagnum jensenii TaxID=128206 RepID=A0ABP0VDX2_9BRYO